MTTLTKKVKFGTKEWANNQLRYAIRVLKGRAFRSTPEGRIEVALFIKRRLERYGFWWQAKEVDGWVHRYQKERNVESNAEKPDESLMM